ncbi:uncharacterized protein LOC128472509 [Spea bombifrons]|uniref:uncharacterized protein LOC128472509 n=1 Tax=Spea bombifrons TaxID=233779 RepID=UPI00234AEA68|nr:uncharacterized protein LOC128472509 [Spea bombifrons]
MSTTLADSITSAIRATQGPQTRDTTPTGGPLAPKSGPPKKASVKSRHTITPASLIPDTGMVRHAQDGTVAPRKRAQYRAKMVRTWKKARAEALNSDSDSDIEEASEWEVGIDQSTSDDEPIFEVPPIGERPDLDADANALLDPQGEPLFDPDNLIHPRSADWFPTEHVAKYIAARVRHPLDKATRNKLKAECPRPTVPDLACNTPDVDPKIAQFLGKTGWRPKKGLDFSLRNCQDKVLDVLGPCARIFEMVEEAISGVTPLDLMSIRGWIQRAICLIGNANTALASERRRAILIKIEPKLVNMATSEPGTSAKGMLFGDKFVKDLGSFVQTFTALDKAQANMKRVFSPKVFGGAGRGRGRLAGRYHRGPNHGSRGPNTSRQTHQEYRPAAAPFFPQRSRPWQNCGARGSYQSRRPYA